MTTARARFLTGLPNLLQSQKQARACNSIPRPKEYGSGGLKCRYITENLDFIKLCNMNSRAPRRYGYLRICMLSIVLLASGNEARGAIPPSFLAQQQDRAVRVYCTYWRNSGRTRALEGDEVKRVVIELEEVYPTVFPACRRPGDSGYCLSWLQVLVQGLRRYGRRSLGEICSREVPFLDDRFGAAAVSAGSRGLTLIGRSRPTCTAVWRRYRPNTMSRTTTGSSR